MRTLKIGVVVVMWSFTYCQPKSKTNSSGLVEYLIIAYDSTWSKHTKPVWTVPAKIWYKDSTAIEEQARLDIITDTNKVTKTFIVVDNYRFNDLRTRTVYVYGSFSDTATLKTKYSLDDTTVETIGGWGFNRKREKDFDSTPEKLSDTSIDNITYSRVRATKVVNGFPIISTYYFRCDNSHPLFTFDTKLSKTIGCPSVKYLSESPRWGKASSLMELNFLRDELTPEEIKVFNAWEQYAKLHPLTK